MNKLAKSAVVASSLCLAAALIAYEGGYIRINLPSFAQAKAPASPPSAVPAQAATAKAPDALLFSTKSAGISAPQTFPAPTTFTAEQMLMFSSKSSIITPPKTTPASTPSATAGATAPASTAPAIFLGGSKSLMITPAPTSATAPPKTQSTATVPAVFLRGSKSDVPFVTPPPTAPASKEPTK